MKKKFTILVVLLFTTALLASSPQKMSYQAVIRNSSGALVTNTQIGMQINIRQGSASGTIVYTETQIPTTNANGLVNIEIGGASGFSAIDWASNTYFIETKTAVVPPLTTYTITGVSQLLSVPYALHAKTASETDPTWSGTPDQTSNIGRVGRVGIGTINPINQLDVVGKIGSTDGIYVDKITNLSWNYAGSFKLSNSSPKQEYVAAVVGHANYLGAGGGETVGQTYGGYFMSNSNSQDGFGVYAYAKKETSTVNVNASGVWALGNVEGNTGVSRGVFGRAIGGLTSYGIYGEASGATTNWAGYFSGNVFIRDTLRIAGGVSTAGKVLTSDAIGNGTWQTVPGLPKGNLGQTLRHDGTNWVTSSSLYHTGINVGIGVNTPAELLHVRNAAGSAKMRLQSTDVSTIEFYNNTAYVAGIGINVSQGHFFIYNGGNVSVKDGNLGIGNVAPAQKLDITAGNGRIQTGYSWLTNSDIRYKTNITTIGNALQSIAKLRGVRYDLKEDKSIVQGQGKHIGFVAQELEIEFPEFVVTDNNGYKSLAYDKMTAVLLQAINEQQTDIQQLKQLVEQQQVQINTLINKAGLQK